MDKRFSKYPVLPQIMNRWSPRAMSGKSVSRPELFTLFEAARWAPSSGNNQPWRFVYSTHRSRKWQDFLGLLLEGNREWCIRAAALVVVISKKNFDFDKTKYSRTHVFDTGAAWENLAVQGASQGLVVHGMEGFDYQKTQELLKIPEGYEVLAMIAIGRPGDPKLLSEKNQAREFPSSRKNLSDVVSKEEFVWE